MCYLIITVRLNMRWFVYTGIHPFKSNKIPLLFPLYQGGLNVLEPKASPPFLKEVASQPYTLTWLRCSTWLARWDSRPDW